MNSLGIGSGNATGSLLRGKGGGGNSQFLSDVKSQLKNLNRIPPEVQQQLKDYKQFKDQVPKGYKVGALQQFDKPQTALYQRLFDYLGPDSYLAKLAQGNPELFAEIESPALQQFSGLQGQLASRFSQGGGAGSLSGRRSSGFQNEATSVASNFAQQLQAQRQGLQRQAIEDMQRLSHALLAERPVERGLFAKPGKKEGVNWGNVASNVAPALIGAASNYFLPGSGAVTGPLAAGAISNY